MKKFVLFATLCFLAIAANAQTKLDGLTGNVDVKFDEYGIPHIFAAKWTDAVRTLGYLHATDRMMQMEVTRRRASGTLAEVMGKDALADDILVRQLGLRRTCEAFWNSGNYPDALKEDLEAYCAGVNAKIKEIGAENDFAPWTPVDCIVFGKYMAWDQSGSNDDLWFGVMLEKLGAEAFEKLWPLDRPYEIPAVRVQADATKMPKAKLAAIPGASNSYLAALGKFHEQWPGREGAFGSNNWAVAGTKTRSGKPMLCSDPHLGFTLPSIWYAAHMSAEGRNIAGVTFAGSPSIVIGHNDHLGWGITNLQTDAVDYFVETVDENDPLKYKHRGEWKTMERISEEVPVMGEAPHKLDIDYTVHGPVISREGRVIAMQWTDLGVTTDALGIFGMNRATNFQEWLEAARQLVAPCINLVYADVEGNIALYCAGSLPIRQHGQGRVPMDGASGDNDWVGMIPKEKMPLAINPDEGFIMSANGRPASISYPFYLGYQWDPSSRTRRIVDMLSVASDLTYESMGKIQNDAHDKFAETFLPVFLQVMTQSDVSDPFAAKLLATVSQWDFVADADSFGTIIWLRWMDEYRKATWDDEWTARGIEKQGGSWGFSGDNRREPMLEVLEFITRENPDSVWFDDRATPERENRDVIIRKAFVTAVDRMKKEIGEDLSKYAWRNFNILRVRSLMGDDSLAREGGPVPGDSFTVNPGEDGGTVGGGASWRMIVDFSDTTSSMGTYPGGQSESENSPHYADLMKLWASGTYAPLRMVKDAASLPADSVKQAMTFTP